MPVTVGRARLVLWLGLAVMAPVPLYTGVVTGLMPPARVLMLAGVCLAVMVLEGMQGAVGLLFLMLLAQALVALAALFAVAHLVARTVGRLPPRRMAIVVGALLVLGVAVTSAWPLYRTPFRARAIQTSLLEVFE